MAPTIGSLTPPPPHTHKARATLSRTQVRPGWRPATSTPPRRRRSYVATSLRHNVWSLRLSASLRHRLRLRVNVYATPPRRYVCVRTPLRRCVCGRCFGASPGWRAGGPCSAIVGRRRSRSRSGGWAGRGPGSARRGFGGASRGRRSRARCSRWAARAAGPISGGPGGAARGGSSRGRRRASSRVRGLIGGGTPIIGRGTGRQTPGFGPARGASLVTSGPTARR